MIKIVLIAISIIILTWFLTNRRTQKARAGVKLAIIVFTLAVLATIVFPELSNDIAHFLGVGRGADLILYGLTLSFIALVLSLYAKSKEDQRRIAILARKIAILEANQNEKK
jgi:hypothetical protein